VTCGVWHEAQTTLGPLAAKATQVGQHGDVSPEAMHHRLHRKALAVLQDMIRQALAKVPSREQVCEDGRWPACANISIADSPSVERPEELPKTFPGTGASAAQAGEKSQTVWEDTSRVCGHVELTPHGTFQLSDLSLRSSLSRTKGD
jgi:hypothetical protein